MQMVGLFLVAGGDHTQKLANMYMGRFRVSAKTKAAGKENMPTVPEDSCLST
jgi:hypothetical protein